MDAEELTATHWGQMSQRLLPAVMPVLLVAVGYIDPGKWAAAIEGGARFGSDLVPLMLIFNFAAILCQYLSAYIAMVTGRDLSQICSEEYDNRTCIFLGVLTEISMIALDLSMILGTAHGFNLIFGVDLFACVFLTAVNALLFPVLGTLLDNQKAKFLCILTASFVFLLYVLGVLFIQSDVFNFPNGTLTKLSGESAFALMSLLGANVMPHNFYLHSSLVQQGLGPVSVSKGRLCHDHLVFILCIFSGIFLINYVLMNAAANVFYSTGLILLTFQDAFSLMDQVSRSSTVPFAFLVVLLLSNQTTALTWNLGEQAVLHNFFGMDIPGWLHHVTIRIIAVIPALCCVWNSGAEGVYQLLIFTQVLVALMLPSSVIPLFRVASSRSVMGTYKISQFVEFLSLITFIGMLALEIIFLIEMIFGNSDWVSNLRWNVGSSTSVSYIFLLTIGSTSFCLMLWLAATPLKSASLRLDAKLFNWGINDAVPESSADIDESDFSQARAESIIKQEPKLTPGMPLASHSDISDKNSAMKLSEMLLHSGDILHLTTTENSSSSAAFPGPLKHQVEEFPTTVESVVVSTVFSEGLANESVNFIASKSQPTDLVEKTVSVEGDLQFGTDNGGGVWEPDESFRGASGRSPSLTRDGPGSYRSVREKTVDTGSDTGSLSRLAGLGRGARYQLATVLDEFWGQLFDLHGQATQEAKVKKLDVLLGIDFKIDSKPPASFKVDTAGGYFQSVDGRISDSIMNSGVYDSPKLLDIHGNIETSYGVQRGSSSSWSRSLQLLDAYIQNPRKNALDYGERRYSSLRLPPSSNGTDYQPATVHGYQIASYLNRIAKAKGSEYLNGQIEVPASQSPSLCAPNCRDPLPFASGRRLQNGLTTMKPPGFSSTALPRKVPLQSEMSYNDPCSPGHVGNLSTPDNTKKFHSLPDISGLSSLLGLTFATPSAFDSFTHSKPYREPLSLQLKSSPQVGTQWSRHPFEPFGMADTSYTVGNEVESKQSSNPIMDMEADLLESFRQCIMKLLKLEGSDWLFRQNDGADEDLVDRAAARERFLIEAEAQVMNRMIHTGESQYAFDRRPGSGLKNDKADIAKILLSSVPHCGDGCIWRVDLIISFGVWCIHRILELLLMESRPKLWGKYTYVLNRLQGIIDLAFLKPRTPMTPCFCLHIPAGHQQKSSPPISNGSLPPPAKQGRGKCTTAAKLLEMTKDVETAISCRKGRPGTAAGDIAFPKGKENLASVLKRYKRRLSNKPVGTLEVGSGPRKGLT
ncbi:hypothetical protein NMG60_11005545 [Bertholletia excelsa]